MSLLKIGDTVEITSLAGIYRTYEEWADLYNLKSFSHWSFPELGSSGKIIAIGKHLYKPDTNLFAIHIDGTDYIADERSFSAPEAVYLSKLKELENDLSTAKMQYINALSALSEFLNR